MSPELALVLRAAFLLLLVFAAERYVTRRRARLAEQRRAVLRLPMVLNPASEFLHGRPLEVSVVRSVAKPVSVVPSNVLRLEPQPAVHITEKRAA